MNYSDKLRDPRWQKKRLKIFERDNWMCLGCGTTDNTLSVHHMKYCGYPWEIEDEYLITVCDYCHERIEENKLYQDVLWIERLADLLRRNQHE